MSYNTLMFITAFLWPASSLPHLQRFPLLISRFSLEIRLLGKSNSSPETHSCNRWSAGWRNKAAVIIAPNIFLPFSITNTGRDANTSVQFLSLLSSVPFSCVNGTGSLRIVAPLGLCSQCKAPPSPQTHTYLKCFSVKGENFRTLWISFKIFYYLWTICKVVFLKIEWIIFQKFLLYFWGAKS